MKLYEYSWTRTMFRQSQEAQLSREAVRDHNQPEFCLFVGHVAANEELQVSSFWVYNIYIIHVL